MKNEKKKIIIIIIMTIIIQGAKNISTVSHWHSEEVKKLVNFHYGTTQKKIYTLEKERMNYF